VKPANNQKNTEKPKKRESYLALMGRPNVGVCVSGYQIKKDECLFYMFHRDGVDGEIKFKISFQT
jgi:hypothetical protein